MCVPETQLLLLSRAWWSQTWSSSNCQAVTVINPQCPQNEPCVLQWPRGAPHLGTQQQGAWGASPGPQRPRGAQS